MFSTFDCAIKGIRKKEDPYNASMFPGQSVRDGYLVSMRFEIGCHS